MLHLLVESKKHTFTISRKSTDFQPSLIVELQDDGFSGFGEATSNPYYKTTVPVMTQDLEKIRTIIENTADETPEVFLGKNSRIFKTRHVCFMRFGHGVQ